MNLAQIPSELMAIAQWVRWRYEARGGGPTKVPVDAKNGAHAKSTDPATWSTFEEARKDKRGVDGIGFVVTAEDGFLGVDIDHCYADGVLDPEAQAIVDQLDSYTEVTVSGHGVRVWIKAKLTRKGNKKHLGNGVSVEFYDRGRYFTVTGDRLAGVLAEIHERQSELDTLHERLFPPRPAQASPHRGEGLTLDDAGLLARAKGASNGAGFASLWSGNTTAHGDDDSSADMALLCHLAFWTRNDASQMDRLFRQSGLYREKWEREDYRIRSINAAIDLTPKPYVPGQTSESFRMPTGSSLKGPQEDDGVVGVDDLSGEIDAYYARGATPGEHPGWESLANLYRVQRGEWTLVTGIPSMGKSTWLDALIVNLITTIGWRFAICSPENQPFSRHFAQLAEKMIVMPFSGYGRMTKEDLDYAKGALRDHVSFILPQYPTIEAVLSLAKQVIDKRGLDGLVIDPWNEMEHSRPSGMSETEYISYALTSIRRFARQHSIHVWIVAHPTKLQKERLLGASGRPLVDNDGLPITRYQVPDPYSVSGSAHWRNKADNCITIHRNMDAAEKDIVQVHVQKIRFRQNGRQGAAMLRWHEDTNSFSDTGTWVRQGGEQISTSTQPQRTVWRNDGMVEDGDG